MGDRVRYHLESSVKELRDLKDRKIFDQEELSKVMKRRTDYEHKLLSRTVKPEDFISYANYERKLDRLRHLRVNRLKLGGKTTVSDYAGPRRIVYTLERGTKRFPSDLKLWTELIEYGHSAKNFKAVKKGLSSLLRTHPRDPDVWVYVAKFQLEQNASVPEARAVMQRALRFNPDSQYLWIEYMRLELIYVAKILARRRILGIENARKEEINENKTNSDDIDLGFESDTDAPTKNAAVNDLPSVNVNILGDIESNPALRGDVALAVLDSSLESVPNSEVYKYVLNVLNMFDQFTSLDRAHLCSHAIDLLGDYIASHPELAQYAPKTEFLEITLPIRHLESTSSKLPANLKLVFNLYAKSSKHVDLKNELRSYLAQKILEQETDASLKKAVELFVARM